MIVVTAILVALRHRVPGALVAWLHAAVAVAPVSGLVHAGSQLVADRYSYLPGIGFAVVAGGGITAALHAWQRGRLAIRMMAALAGVTVVVLVTLGALSWQHSWYWRSSVSLWRWAVAADEACMLCHAKLGAALLAANAPAEAEPPLRRAVDLSPDRAGLRIDHGVALALTGRDADAEREFREATRASARLAGGTHESRRALHATAASEPKPSPSCARRPRSARTTRDCSSISVGR